MTFAHPWLIPLVLAPLLWAAWEWRNSARRAGLALKAAALAAILLALAEPRLTFYESKVGLAIRWILRPAFHSRIWMRPRRRRPRWRRDAGATGRRCCRSRARRAIPRRRN